MSRILKECLPDIELDIISLKDFDDVEEPIEDGTTFSENAVLKAKYYYDIFKIPTIADKTRSKTKAMMNTTTITASIFTIPTLLMSLKDS